MRFTIRDLLWLTVAIGLVIALWLERRSSPPVRFTGQQLAPGIYADTAESGPCCTCEPGSENVGTIIQGALAKHY